MPADKKEITQAGIDKEMSTLEISLIAKVSRTAITLDEYIEIRLSQGTTIEVIRADLLKDLNEGGRIFGEFLNAVKPTFAGSVGRFRDVGAIAEIGIEKKWRWVAVLVNTCPDCLKRHNQAKIWEDWEAEGLPRTGATVCKEWCKCVLVPDVVAILEPIYRGN